MKGNFEIVSIGTIRNNDGNIWLEIYDEFTPALLNLEYFSHIITLWWISGMDTKESRSNLQGYPRVMRNEDTQTPLSGIFATRSPKRPNPIGLTIVKIIGIEEKKIYITHHDAFDNTPLIDIKPYIPNSDCILNVKLPNWFELLKEKREE
ncbi:MAG: tRNA (N6-threonylcarbamoyladenosine(37)-N6)-methyltransferase TrmO [Candidatus Heimdallarchaeota archaeon]|nr:tRNA (N6-threonylcarbamoyladenosine(37)-N6)-methyltransferase TrmO [Candidatus Heimdallarchaeota archaeon]